MTYRIAEGSTVLHQVGDPGIVMFGNSMHVTYVSERAQTFFACARSASSAIPATDDLMFQIVKAVARVRDRLSVERRDESCATTTEEITVSTASGPFDIMAFPIPPMNIESHDRIMVIIHKCQPRRKIPGTLREMTPVDLAFGSNSESGAQ